MTVVEPAVARRDVPTIAGVLDNVDSRKDAEAISTYLRMREANADRIRLIVAAERHPSADGVPPDL